jgi:nitrite reductase/ring-hydroxylating ferredoxin subunit
MMPTHHLYPSSHWVSRMADKRGEWLTVALSETVSGNQPVGIRCDGREFVLFRDSQGQVHALIDQCAHRRAALSLGVVTPTGLLQCPYHGWRYEGQTGVCKSIPNLAANEPVPRTYRVAAFDVVEEAGWIHLWTGGAEATEPSPQLAMPPAPHQWHGEKLLAFPAQALADLLLDAPSVVLNVSGLAIFDLHRFGDPIVTAEHIEVVFAADQKRRKGIIADFTRAVRIRMAHSGKSALIMVETDSGEELATSTIAISPFARSVSSVRWRGSNPTEANEVRIDIRDAIDGVAAGGATDYCSRLRVPARNAIPQSFEGAQHERANQ